MIKKYLLITLAAFLLAACGGSDDKPLFPETDGSLGGSTDTGGGSSPDTGSDTDTDGGTDADGAEESVLVKLGAYSGGDFKESVIHASNLYLTSNEEIDLEASIVNPSAGNSYTNESFGVRFSSACTEASSKKHSEIFTPVVQTIPNGKILAKYKAGACSEIGAKEDLITLSVYQLKDSEIDYTSEAITASVKILIEKPTLEQDYIDNTAALKVEPSIITLGGKTVVSAYVIGSDEKPSKKTYQTSIESSCAAAIITPDTANNPSGNITNGYYKAEFDAQTCTGIQTITLTLNDSSGAKIGTAQGQVEILDAQLEALAVSAPMATLAIGESTQITSKIVDSNGQVVTNAEYMVRYASSCTNGSFSSNDAVVRGGVAAQYKARYCAGGTDTVTFTLFPLDDAGAVLEDLVLGAKTIDVSITNPEIGYLSSGVFTPGLNGESNIKARESIELSAIVAGTEVGGVKRRITTTDFYAELISSCGADFEKESELTQKGTFSMLYKPNDCRGADNVTVNLYDLDDKNEPIYTDLVATTTFNLAIENPHIGYIDGTDFKAGEITPVPVQLSAGGTVNLEAIIADGNDVTASKLTDSRYTVTFTSKCAEDEPAKAEFSHAQKIVRDGNVTVQYTAMGCLGQDDVSFKLYSVDSEDSQSVLHEASVSIDIAEQELSNIAYLSDGVDQLLAIKGIANNNLPNSSKLAFKVTDKNGDPIPNKTVEFELSKASGGVELTWYEATTNDEGIVETTINSGTAHAVVSVKASIYIDGDNDNTAPENILSTYSFPFTITTGLPQQYGFEISADVFNPPAYNFNGSIVNVSVIAYDMWGNPVPDGTAVNFIAESGAIEPSCTTVGGNCSVEWQSGGQRPGQTDLEYNFKNEIDPLTGESLKGMTTILAYTEGEAGFNDSNANGQYDDLESTKYFPEAFLNSDWSLDGNNEHAWNDHEFVDYNNDETYTVAPSTYQGAVCSDSAKGAGHCESLMHVRSQIRIMQSMKDSIAMRIFENCGADYTGCTEVSTHTLDPVNGGVFWVVLQDGNGNIPAAGASLTVAPSGYKIFGTSGNVRNSIGELGVSLFSPLNPYTWELPRYGQIYEVQYVPEDDPKDITLTAQSGEGKASILLTP